MSESNIAVLLDESKAYWYDSAHLGLLPDQTIVREWKHIPVDCRAEALAELHSRRKETNPSAQGRPYDGIFRIQKIEDIVERDRAGNTSGFTIREYMAFGLATTLVGETVRLVEGDDLPSTAKTEAISPAHDNTSTVEQPYRTLTLRWINIDPASINSIVSERSTLTQSSITVAGETYTGPWYLISRKPSWAEDGSGVYTEKWAMAGFAMESHSKKGDMEVTADRVIANVPKDLVQSVCAAEISALGANYGYPGFTYEQRIRWGTDTAEIQTFSTDTPGKDVTRKAEIAEAYQVDIHTYKHAHTLPDADSFPGHTFGQGLTMEVDGDITDDGDFDYKHRVRTAIKQLIAKFTSRITAYFKEEETKGDNLYDADMSSYTLSTQTAGVITTIEKAKNQDGTYRVVKTDNTSTEITSAESQKRVEALTTEEIVKGRNLTSEPSLPSDTQTDGVVSIIRKTFNDYQRWDKEETTETAHYKVSSGSYPTRYGTAYWWVVRNATVSQWASVISAASLDSTTDNTVQYDINRFNLRDGTILKRPIRETGEIPGWIIGKIGEVTLVGERKYNQHKNLDWMYKNIEYTVTEWQCSDHASAQAYIDGGLASSPLGESKVIALSNGQYIARKIESNEAEATWIIDSELS